MDYFSTNDFLDLLKKLISAIDRQTKAIMKCRETLEQAAEKTAEKLHEIDNTIYLMQQ